MNVKPEQKHIEEPNVVCRFISEWFMKRKLQKFEKEFDNYYNGLIMMGDLYDAKVRLLTYMKKNKSMYLKNYLENGISVSRQIDEMLSKNGI